MLALPVIAATRFLVGGRAHWAGSRPTPRQRIYFANHGSHLDTVVLWAALPKPLRAQTRPVAAADYWDKGRLRRAFALGMLNAVLIDRGAGPAALVPLAAALGDGASLIVFPEGTRGDGPLPAAFKSGLYHLARDFPEVELVPVYLDNLNRAMPKGAWIPIPVGTAAIFGAPLGLEPGEDKARFLARARAALVALGRERHPETLDG